VILLLHGRPIPSSWSTGTASGGRKKGITARGNNRTFPRVLGRPGRDRRPIHSHVFAGIRGFQIRPCTRLRRFSGGGHVVDLGGDLQRAPAEREEGAESAECAESARVDRECREAESSKETLVHCTVTYHLSPIKSALHFSPVQHDVLRKRSGAGQRGVGLVEQQV
jgi:hypothetical protein